jgi:glutaredoxin
MAPKAYYEEIEMSNTVELDVFTNEGCDACEELKTWLDERQVKYNEHDIHDPALDKELAATAMVVSAENGMAMPVAVLGGVGMTAEQVKKCDGSGLLPTIIGCALTLVLLSGCNPLFPLI